MSAREIALFLSLLLFLGLVAAFDNSRKDNLAVYWGQDSANSQKPLSFYCQNDTIDAIPLAFLYIFRGAGGEPVLDLANTCSVGGNPVFPGTDLIDCSFMAADIKTCQSKGKIITLSLGGATGKVGFSSDSEAESFADQIWHLFLGGTSLIRPFGDVVLDGVDLDIESGTPAHYAAFVSRIRWHESSSKKKYYITAAPQCVFPDANIGAALNAASFDAVYVQFYNNDCGLNHPSAYNFDTWDTWAKTKSFNKDIKVYIGAPGSQDAAGEGYVGASTLADYAHDAQKKYSSFGGVMLWDADTAYTNNRYDQAIKTAMSRSAEALFPNEFNSSIAATATAAATTPTPAHEVLKKEPRRYSRFFRY